MSVTYEIVVHTGKRVGAGTDATIHVILIGTLGEGVPHELDKWMHDDFRAGAEDVYEVTDQDLGDLIALRFVNSTELIDDDWLLDNARVTAGGKSWYFPFYR